MSGDDGENLDTGGFVPDIVSTVEGSRSSQDNAVVRTVAVKKGTEVSQSGSLCLGERRRRSWEQSEEGGPRKQTMTPAEEALHGGRQSAQAVVAV